MGLDLWCVEHVCAGYVVGLDLWRVGACLCWICGGSRLVACRSMSVLDMWWV